MRLRHIEVFNAIMLTGSVSAAARLINITQPAVSRTLQHAEIQLGFSLFQRAKGRLTATTEALTLYPHIERLFAQLDEVQRLAANLRTAGDTLIRQELCAEAIRLARMLCEVDTPEPENFGLLALMLLHDSRRHARVDDAGMLITLEDQDRAVWDREQIREGLALVEAALRRGSVGRYPR